MTLVITMVRPEGIWQSVDYRVRRGNEVVSDAAPKQLKIQYRSNAGPSCLLIAFTGLAILADGTPMAKWIRQTLRGDDQMDGRTMIELLTQRLARDVGGSVYWDQPLILIGGAVEGEKRLAVKISNIDPATNRPGRDFQVTVEVVDELESQSFVFIEGSGKGAISQSDLDLLNRQSGIRPAKWQNYTKLLAAINRRSVTNAESGGVSPWCQVTHLNKQAHPDSQVFSAVDEEVIPPMINMVFMGIDLEEAFAPHRFLSGAVEGDDDAGNRAVTPRD